MKATNPLKFYFTSTVRYCVIYNHEMESQTYLKYSLSRALGRENISFVETYSSSFIGETISKIISSGQKVQGFNLADDVKKEISGIICPLGITDNYDLANVMTYSLPLEEQIKFIKDKPERKDIENFFEHYLGGIPVFESYLFLPDKNAGIKPIGSEFKPRDFLPLIQTGYNIWIDKNKDKWLAEIEKRKENNNIQEE